MLPLGMFYYHSGSYHQVFWNCQHFANCLLDIICSGKYQRITTGSEALQRVMFLSIRSAHTATTELVQNFSNNLTLDQQSDAIIDASVQIPRLQKDSDDNNNSNTNCWYCVIQ